MNKFYVYTHVCPKSGQTVYVGKGCGGRAWDVSRSRSCNVAHLEWLNTLMDEGYLPLDWVRIIERGLPEKEALTKEKEFLHTNGTLRFCMQSGERQHQSKLTDAQAIAVYRRAGEGENHQALADEFGVSRSCISMIASGKQWKATTAHLRRARESN